MPTPPNPTQPSIKQPTYAIARPLAGQMALVTGGSSGIGKGIAIALGMAGADVVINYRSNKNGAEEAVADVKRQGCRAYAHQCDVSREDEVQSMFRRMLDEFGTIDILVNNSGHQMDSPFQDMTLEQWNGVIGTNLTGQFLCVARRSASLCVAAFARRFRARRARSFAFRAYTRSFRGRDMSTMPLRKVA